MTGERQMADIPHEGQPFFGGAEEETPEASPAENNNADGADFEEGEDDQEGGEEGGDGDQKPDTDPDANVPFHQHPRWKNREEEWQKKFNEQETRHQDDIKAIREEFGAARKENAENIEIPSWFGGTQEQWNEYRQWNDKQIISAEDRALTRINEEKSAESKAVQEATEYMKGEIEFIESDKAINPNGSKVDPNKLLKIVMDNDLVDSKGRWNYRAGFRMMRQSGTQQPAPNGDRKVIAGATTVQPQRGESKPKDFKTQDDFKNNRPW
jgi:hypothetical protein